jgi:alanine-synthesizing transaminase
VLEKARQMEEDGHKIIKLNIGNLAVFGLEPPDEIVQDMIRNLPNAAGYTDSKGMFAPRKAIVHYTPAKGHQGRDGRRRLPRQRRLRADRDGTNALLNDGDEVLLPAPDYPLWTAAVRCPAARPVHYICDEQRLDARPRRHPPQDHAATPRRSSSSTRTTRPARSTPTSLLREIVASRAEHS